MKIAVPSTTPDLDGMVENKLGTAAHLLVVETDDMSVTALDGPQRSSVRGAGVQAVSQVVAMGARVILVGYIAPHIANVLEKRGVEIVSQITGPVSQAIADYMALRVSDTKKEPFPKKSHWNAALGGALRQLQTFLPRLVGVILLLGLFLGFVPYQTLLSLFSGSAVLDSFWGACLGSIMAGNPVNSYVIGKGLFNVGVGMAGVTALMLAWVNVGLIQLPAESTSLGVRFTLIRNMAAFIIAIMMSFLMALFTGGGA